MTSRAWAVIRTAAIAFLIAASVEPALHAVAYLAVVQIVSGPGQTGTISTQLPSPLIIQVFHYDTSDNLVPAAGVEVQFSIANPANGAFLSNVQGTTGPDGTASAQLTLGMVAGPYQVIANCLLPCAGTAVTFNESAVMSQPPNPPTLTLAVCSDASCQTPSTSDLKVLPSRFPLPFIGCNLITYQPKTVAFKVGCFDAHTGAPSANCSANLSIAPVEFSGGHDHDDANRPPGTLDVTSGATGAAGLPVTYTAPEVSGDMTLSLSGTDSSGAPLVASTATIHVEVEGLAPLADAPQYYALVGSKPEHEDNHFSLPYMNTALVAIAKDVSTDPAFSGVTISYNDQSLVQGGIFDLSQNWGPPHCGHLSLGGGTNNVDVGLVDLTLRARLEKIIKKHGGRVCVKHADHWHLCF